MKSIEQYIREKLGRPDAPVEVDADDLWAGIEDKLASEDEKPSVLAPWPWKALFFGLLLLMAVGIAGWAVMSNSTPDSAVEPIATSSQTDNPPRTVNNTPDEILSGTAAAGTASEASPTATSQATKNSSPSAGSGLIAPAPQKAIFAPASATKSGCPRTLSGAAPAAEEVHDPEDAVRRNLRLSRETFPEPRIAPKKANELSIKKGSAISTSYTDNEVQTGSAKVPSKAENAVNKQVVDDKTSSTPASEVTAAIPGLPFVTIEPLVVAPVRLSPTVRVIPPTFKNALSSRLSLGLNAGSNLLFTRYAAPTEEGQEALNAAVKPAAGSSFGFDLRYQISKKFALSTGLEYHRTLNTFEHTTQQDSTIQHPSPFNSGSIDAFFSRRVTDNLRTRFFTAPIFLHWTQAKGNFDFGIGAGVGLNFRQFANGTTLNPSGNFVPFDAATGPSTTPKFFMSYRLSPSVSYRLKPESQLSLEAKADFRYLPFGADELSGLKRNSLFLGLSIGLRYGF